MPPLNILIKPASSACNLRCKYCFYCDEAENRTEKNYGMMTGDILEVLVKKAFEYGESYVGFAFQGGEPTLAGLGFYRKLIELQQKYNRKKVKIGNAIQTNGTLIDADWAEFLAKNRFLVGVSLDGPKDIHDLNRVDAQGKGSYNRIMKTVALFKQYGVEYNILSVVCKSVARHIGQVYHYFVKQGFGYLQFIPCLDSLGAEPGQSPYSLTPRLYEDFLKRLFDLWYHDFMANGRRVSVRMFDNILQMLLGYPPESCDMKGHCSANLVVEADGSVYPCDFYVLDEWKMGNIRTDSPAELLQGDTAQAFVAVSEGISEQCRGCEVYALCRGGCRRYYEPIIDGKIGHKNYFCSAYKAFYQYALPRFQEVLQAVVGPVPGR
jgi:uncharacterized protein